jgi:ribosomal-protein-alanine N-acetyltransferase
LRRFCEDDLAHVIEWSEEAAANRESEAQRFLEFCFRQYELTGEGPWAMMLKATQKVVGNCGYVGIQHSCGEVNYYVARRFRGQGLASEAVKALLDFGFRELGLLRIQARCAPNNPASEKVLQKIGMKFAGVLEPEPGTGTSSGEKLYAVLRQDFEKPAELRRD